jgi:hypothetical protein
MEDKINIVFFGKKMTTSIYYLGLMKNDLNCFVNGRKPQYICRWKLTKLALASPELGTAQPQLVFHFVKF